MKILMVAPQPFFEPRGTPFSVLGRLKALSQLGHEVDLVTYHVGQNVQIPGLTIYRTPVVPLIKRVSIGPSLVKLFLDGLLLIRVFMLLVSRKYDLLHSHEEAGFFNMVFAKWFKIRHLYDMHSSLPQQLRNFEYTKFTPLIALFEWLECSVVNSSQAIITICPALETRVKEIRLSPPHVLIENVATEGDPAEVPEEEIQKFIQTYSLKGKRVILYTGTFEAYQGLDILIESAKDVVQQIPEAMFLMMGGTVEQVVHYQDRVSKLGLAAHFQFTGMQPPQEVPRAIRVADVLVSPRVSGTNTPLKIYAYLQSGKPIVATNLDTHTQVLNVNVACLVEPEAPAFAQGILDILQKPALGEQLGKEAQKLFASRFSFATYLEKTRQVVNLAVR